MNSKVLDESIAESLQTLDLLCFSEQYYFLLGVTAFGVLLVVMGVTTFLRTQYNFFGDPVMPVIVVVMLLWCDLIQYPPRRRSLASPFSAVAASTEYPRPRRGGAATRLHGLSPRQSLASPFVRRRLHGISASPPRRRRDPSPRNVAVSPRLVYGMSTSPPAASPLLVSTEYPLSC